MRVGDEIEVARFGSPCLSSKTNQRCGAAMGSKDLRALLNPPMLTSPLRSVAVAAVSAASTLVPTDVKAALIASVLVAITLSFTIND
jgi:hypothetical protein